MSDAFKSFLDTFPALPPGVPASVPPPPPVAVAPPVPEAGFINPPEAPKVAAASPEHAAVLQGIVAPPPPPVDDLDALSRDQLKALAVMSGAEPENTRKREAALRDAIRLHRAQNGTERSAPCGTAPKAEPAIEAAVQLATEAITNGHEERRQTVPLVEAPSAPVTPAPTSSESAMHAALGVVGTGWTLFIDCAPLDGSGVPFSSLVERANKMILDAGGPADYRLVEFGKGNGHLATAISDILDTHPGDDIVVESMTHEGMCCISTLIARAGRVVRAFR
jgi:hypothetical protein